MFWQRVQFPTIFECYYRGADADSYVIAQILCVPKFDIRRFQIVKANLPASDSVRLRMVITAVNLDGS
jgi:hypothetical protein